jgi:tyrosine-protein kinase Etk/Wzc
MDRKVAIAPLWDRVWSRRRSIFVLVMSATILVGVVAYLLPPWYKAKTELLPPAQEESSMGLAALLRGVSVPGVKIAGESTPADVFIAILNSRRINEEMVKRFDLRNRYHVKLMDDAILELLDHARFKLTGAGTIEITVEDKDRQRAADMANAYVEFLDRFNRDVRMTKGRRTRLFIESRLLETKQELTAAETRLAEYQAKHKAVALTAENSSAIEQAASLYAKRTALQVRLGVVRGYSDGSDEEIQIRQELDELDRQMRQLPMTGLELARLVRDVKVEEQLYALLTAQYEDARITEARDVVTVEILDLAGPPEKKARPRRTLMMAGAFLLSLALGVGLAALREEERHPPVMRAVASE